MAAAAWCVLGCLLAIWLATRMPWLGLSLSPQDGSDTVRIVHAEGPAQDAATALRLISIAAPGLEALPLAARDLVEEPDFAETVAEFHAFLERQDALAARLRSPVVHLEVLESDGASTRRLEITPAAQRPVSSLPFVFWFQLFVGAAMLMIGMWVFVLRPADLGARLFAALGATMPFAAWSAAVYSTRELAMDAPVFDALSACNQTGSFAFGAALISLFLVYPCRLARTKHLGWIAATTLVAATVHQLEIIPSLNLSLRLPLLLMMIAAVAATVWQWRATRHDPRARAAVRWLGLSAMLGCGLFVVLIFATRALGWLPPLTQGYSFGFFLLMDVGLALGLRRYRLFELDEWAHRLWLWIGGVMLLLALDAALVALLHMDPTLSLGVALLLAGFAYLPARNWLWARLVVRRRMSEPALFQSLTHVAFAVGPVERERRWRAVLQALFEPMRMAPAAAEVPHVRMEGDGLALLLPATASAPALRLAYPWAGRGLFGPRHLKLATQIISFMQHADANRDAYDRGVKEERLRIARDLHDDVGARLLSGLSQHDLGKAHDSIRDAMGDMRSIVNALSGRQLPWSELWAELRHEAGSRLEAAGITLDWPLEEADADDPLFADPVPRHLTSALREVVSNIIRHSGATQVSVLVQRSPHALALRIADNGHGFDTTAAPAGRGLLNLQRRLKHIHGEASIHADAQGTRITLTLALPHAASHPPALAHGL